MSTRIHLDASGAAQSPEEIDIAGVSMVADMAGALWLADEKIIVVADLHLEKGSSLARRRGPNRSGAPPGTWPSAAR